jgi:hypothetical protein
MAIDVPTVQAPPPAPAVITASESEDFAQRWAEWQKKGAAHDRAVRRKMVVVIPILIVVAAAIIYALLGR